MTQFDSVYEGEECSTYYLNAELKSQITVDNLDYPLFIHGIIQAREYKATEEYVVSLDFVLGLIGGFAGLVWSLLELSLSDY